ncbi:MAG TPA: flagellar FliJ family protein [Verrucomicrobiae bacterium]|nr:flagellar FliJ family protein [Verrucomicrobiae bacterium]
MKGFSFPLESIRVLRQQRERAAQQRYSRSLMQRDSAEQVLKLAGDELAAGYQLLGGEMEHGAGVSRIIHLRTWCNVLEIRLHECEAALEEARQAAAEAFNFMCAARRDRETLDRFHDKSHTAWQRSCQLAEQKMLDEMAVQRQSAPALEHTRMN